LIPPQKFAKISWQTASENDIVSFLKLRGLMHREKERERERAQGSSCFKGFAEICNRSSVHLLRFTMRRSKICCILPHHPSQSLFEKMHTVTLSLLELRKKLSPALKT